MLEGGGNLPTAVKPYMADSSSAGVDTVSKTYKALPTSLLPPPPHTQHSTFAVLNHPTIVSQQLPLRLPWPSLCFTYL